MLLSSRLIGALGLNLTGVLLNTMQIQLRTDGRRGEEAWAHIHQLSSSILPKPG